MGDQGINGSYGWHFPLKVMGDKYYAFLTSGSFTATGEVTGKLNYFNVRYLYSHKIKVGEPSFGISISKNGVKGSISLIVATKHRGYPSSTGGIETIE